MRLCVLGSAAGGGFPQWNCACPNCRAVRAGDPALRPRTQSSLAVRAEAGPWYLINASPDVRAQLELLEGDAASSVRRNPVGAVVLTDAELDHTAGLLVLREGSEPLRLIGTGAVRTALTDGYPVLPLLDCYSGAEWELLEPDRPLALGDGLELEAFAAGGELPLYMAGRRAEGAVVGLVLRGETATAVYAPGLAVFDTAVLERLSSADCVLVDGTCWQDDELGALGISTRTARQMGHVPLAGEDGSLELISGLPAARKILVHLNNTNPVLRADSPERRAVESRGIEVAYDGMEIDL